MKKRKLKRFVLPTLYGMVLSIIVISLGLISKLTPVSTNYEYATNGIIDAVMPVFDEEKLITKPVEDNIKIKNDYYSKDDEKNIQQDYLIQMMYHLKFTIQWMALLKVLKKMSYLVM